MEPLANCFVSQGSQSSTSFTFLSSVTLDIKTVDLTDAHSGPISCTRRVLNIALMVLSEGNKQNVKIAVDLLLHFKCYLELNFIF